ncbi:hypothetical protein TNCV_5009661 [Trichonephila clavipes]|nr:hypothetical protein TNCV_5009661 [Trichonephila clavipes]
MKPSNCDANLSSFNAEGNDGADRTWAVMDRSAASRTIAQTIKSVVHHFQHGQWNGTVFCFLTNPASACNITVFLFDF